MHSERHLVFLDADVLAAPLTRTVVLMAAFQTGSRFGVRWSLEAEAEADKHARSGQMRVSDMRLQFEWAESVLVADSDGTVAMTDTDAGDWHILSAAHQAMVGVIVTRNVHHFGHQDLSERLMSAVQPDHFLATVVTPQTYQMTLTDICANRIRQPNTPSTLHAALARQHPRLFSAMATLFPDVEPERDEHKPPAELFRGIRCIQCQEEFSSTGPLVNGVGPRCRGISTGTARY